MKFTVATILAVFAVTAFAQAPANAGIAVNLPSLGVSNTNLWFFYGANHLLFFNIASFECWYSFHNHLVSKFLVLCFFFCLCISCFLTVIKTGRLILILPNPQLLLTLSLWWKVAQPTWNITIAISYLPLFLSLPLPIIGIFLLILKQILHVNWLLVFFAWFSTKNMYRCTRTGR